MFQLIKQNQSGSSSKLKVQFAKGRDQKDVKSDQDIKSSTDNANNQNVDPILQQKSEVEIFKNNYFRKISGGSDDPNSSTKT